MFAKAHIGNVSWSASKLFQKYLLISCEWCTKLVTMCIIYNTECRSMFRSDVQTGRASTQCILPEAQSTYYSDFEEGKCSMCKIQ